MQNKSRSSTALWIDPSKHCPQFLRDLQADLSDDLWIVQPSALSTVSYRHSWFPTKTAWETETFVESSIYDLRDRNQRWVTGHPGFVASSSKNLQVSSDRTGFLNNHVIKPHLTEVLKSKRIVLLLSSSRATAGRGNESRSIPSSVVRTWRGILEIDVQNLSLCLSLSLISLFEKSKGQRRVQVLKWLWTMEKLNCLLSHSLSKLARWSECSLGTNSSCSWQGDYSNFILWYNFVDFFDGIIFWYFDMFRFAVVLRNDLWGVFFFFYIARFMNGTLGSHCQCKQLRQGWLCLRGSTTAATNATVFAAHTVLLLDRRDAPGLQFVGL